VVKARISSSAKQKGRTGRSPEYIFVGGEEFGYFANSRSKLRGTNGERKRTVEDAPAGRS
jgi:hypothetical protein